MKDVMASIRYRRNIGKMLAPLFSLIPAVSVGILFCMILAPFMDVTPLELIGTIWKGAWGSRDAAATSITKATPLLLTGLAVGMAYHAGLLNIGCEGQLTLGALAAASVAVAAPQLPPILLVPLTVLTGALAGGLWALLPVLLRQYRGVHEVVSTLLMNYVAIYFADYLVLGPLGDGSAMGRTPAIPAGAVWPPLWSFGASGVSAAPLVALALSLLAALWLSGTLWGYEVTAVGAGTAAARAAGIPVERWRRRIFVLSGALAGLAGALEVMTVHHRFYRAFSPGYGFDGITVAFLVGNAPGWLWLSALLPASLRAADKLLQLELNISPSIVLVLQAVLLLSATCQARLISWLKQLISSIFTRKADIEQHPRTN